MALSPEAVIALFALFAACVPGAWFVIRKVRRRQRSKYNRSLLPMSSLDSQRSCIPADQSHPLYNDRPPHNSLSILPSQQAHHSVTGVGVYVQVLAGHDVVGPARPWYN
ncbi:hypothetical protein BDV18DRAFT_109732 [Aspergillus unguis]